MAYTTFIPKRDIDHLMSVFEDISESPHVLDISREQEGHDWERVTVVDDEYHVEFSFRKQQNGDALITCMNIGMYTDHEMIHENSLYPEVRFEIHDLSHHSLAWDGLTDIEEIVTPERMRGIIKIARRMKECLTNVFDDEEMH